MNKRFGRSALLGVAAAVSLAWAPPSDARVTKIVIDKTEAPLCVTRNSAGACTATDPNYKGVTGRAFGELDPGDSHNSEITDLSLAPKNASHNAEYIASFFVVQPIEI